MINQSWCCTRAYWYNTASIVCTSYHVRQDNVVGEKYIVVDAQSLYLTNDLYNFKYGTILQEPDILLANVKEWLRSILSPSYCQCREHWLSSFEIKNERTLISNESRYASLCVITNSVNSWHQFWTESYVSVWPGLPINVDFRAFLHRSAWCSVPLSSRVWPYT